MSSVRATERTSRQALARRARLAVGFLTLAFLLRGVFLNLGLPYGDPLDEPFHCGYAFYVAETGKIPLATIPSMPAEALRPFAWLPRSTQSPGPRLSWREFSSLTAAEKTALRKEAFRDVPAQRRAFVTSNYESQQPPVAYLLAAGLLRVAARQPLDRRILLLRLAGSAVACLAVPLAFLFFRRLLPRAAALGATFAFVTFPGLGSFVGRFTNDALELPIVAGILVLIADVPRGRHSWRGAVALGGLLALGCWTKLYLVLLVPAAPLAATLAPRGRRRRAVIRMFAAGSLALLLFFPWMLRQRADTGDWMGLTPSKQAVEIRLGWQERIAALSEIVTPRFAIVFTRTFLWPGTWSAMGAPAAVAVLLAVMLGLLAVLPTLRRGCRSLTRRRSYAGPAVTVALFLAGVFAYADAFAAVARVRGHTPSGGAGGWYLLILLPVVLAAGCATGRRASASLFLWASGVFLVCEWWLTFGVLPAVYSGWTQPNGANVPFREYAIFASPSSTLRIFGDVGLATGPALRLALAGWLGALIAGFAVQAVHWPKRGHLDRLSLPLAG